VPGRGGWEYWAAGEGSSKEGLTQHRNPTNSCKQPATLTGREPEGGASNSKKRVKEGLKEGVSLNSGGGPLPGAVNSHCAKRNRRGPLQKKKRFLGGGIAPKCGLLVQTFLGKSAGQKLRRKKEEKKKTGNLKEPQKSRGENNHSRQLLNFGKCCPEGRKVFYFVRRGLKSKKKKKKEGGE